MSDSLRDRIAAAVERGISDSGPGDFGAVADSVIAELGLRQQGLRNGFYLVGEPPWDKHRYITDWEGEDE